MREIKFRAWITDSYNKSEMVYLDYAGLKKFDYEAGYALSFSVDAYHEFYAHECYEDRVKKQELMQYTGLKDKNGKDIFEGDVVRVINDSDCGPDCEHMQGVGVVNYNESYTCFYWGEFGVFYWGRTKSIEVIGNIYEHPYLLTENK